MKQKVRDLARIVEIQKLAKARHETRLAAVAAELRGLADEIAALSRMQDERYETGKGFIPVATIVSRLDTLMRRKEAAEAVHEAETQALLRASRTLDHAEESHAVHRRAVDRDESAKALDEALAQAIVRAGSSLP